MSCVQDGMQTSCWLGLKCRINVINEVELMFDHSESLLKVNKNTANLVTMTNPFCIVVFVLFFSIKFNVWDVEWFCQNRNYRTSIS